MVAAIRDRNEPDRRRLEWDDPARLQLASYAINHDVEYNVPGRNNE
jgi:hypothetical protein